MPASGSFEAFSTLRTPTPYRHWVAARTRTRTLSQIGAQCTYHYETASGEMISPCGLVAWSAFNDSFAISDAAGNAIALNETGIAWPSDLGNKFSNAENGTTGLNFPLFAQWRQATCAQLLFKLRAVHLVDGAVRVDEFTQDAAVLLRRCSEREQREKHWHCSKVDWWRRATKP